MTGTKAMKFADVQQPDPRKQKVQPRFLKTGCFGQFLLAVVLLAFVTGIGHPNLDAQSVSFDIGCSGPASPP